MAGPVPGWEVGICLGLGTYQTIEEEGAQNAPGQKCSHQPHLFQTVLLGTPVQPLGFI